MEFDIFYIVEIAIISVIAIFQTIVFIKNAKAVSSLKEAIPASHLVGVEFVEVDKNGLKKRVPTIEITSKLSGFFASLAENINDFLLKKSSNIKLKEIKELIKEKLSSLEDSIESVIAQPLYLGLLGTFGGVIIGLFRIAITGVTTDAIQSFIGGVLIGMIASGFGLLLTIISNGLLKNAKIKKDYLFFELTFFLKENLSLDQGATLEELNQLKENFDSFKEEFMSYQLKLNDSLKDTLTHFTDLKEVFSTLRSAEPGLSSIGQVLKAQTGIIDKQASNIAEFGEKVKDLSSYLKQSGEEIRNIIQNEGSNTGRTSLVSSDQDKTVELLSKNEATQKELLVQVNNLSGFLKESLNTESNNNFISSPVFKVFTFVGIGGFGVGIALGILFIIKNFI